jgi:hypothetical protein
MVAIAGCLITTDEEELMEGGEDLWIFSHLVGRTAKNWCAEPVHPGQENEPIYVHIHACKNESSYFFQAFSTSGRESILSFCKEWENRSQKITHPPWRDTPPQYSHPTPCPVSPLLGAQWLIDWLIDWLTPCVQCVRCFCKVAKSAYYLRHGCLFVCSHVSTRLPLDGFCWNFILKKFKKKPREHLSFLTVGRKYW